MTRFRVTQKAVLFDRGSVLVVRDAADGDWEFPGGRVDGGERPVASVAREVREETGLEPTLAGPVFTATKGRKRGTYFVYYRGQVESRDVALSDEHDDHDWLAPARVTERVNDRRARALERAIDGDVRRGPDS